MSETMEEAGSILAFPWDELVVTLIALAIFGHGHRSRLSDENAAAYRKRWATDLPPDTVPL